MSIVRVGLAETKNFAEGFDAIFGGRKPAKKAAKPGKKPRPNKAAKRTGKKK